MFEPLDAAETVTGVAVSLASLVLLSACLRHRRTARTAALGVLCLASLLLGLWLESGMRNMWSGG